MTITNMGIGDLNWSAEISHPWISISQETGTAPSVVNVSVNPNGLPIGDHTGEITIIGSSDVRESPQKVDILLSIRELNHPPDRPQAPSGPERGVAGVEYLYSTVFTDPDGDSLKYVFDWGDGLTETEFVDSGVLTTKSHSWKDAGAYEIRVKAIDQRGAESPWSAPCSVVIYPPTSELITAEEADAYVYLGTSSSQSTHAQSFVALGSTINKVSVALARHRTPSANIYLGIRDSLKGDDLFRAVIRANQVSSADVYNPSWVEIELDPPLEVVQGETYYLVLTSYGSSTNAYKLSCNRLDPYADGMLFAGASGDPMSTYDILMKVVFGGGTHHENRAPYIPEMIEGPQSGKTGIAYEYSTSTVDPDGDAIRFVFDWGDGTTTTTDLVMSGSTISQSHTWHAAGVYQIRAKAIDEYEAQSNWSSPFPVTVSETVPPGEPETLVISDEVLRTDYLGTSSTKSKISQSFTAVGGSIKGVSVALAKYRNPTQTITIGIRSSLRGTNLVYARIDPSQIMASHPQEPGWVEITFPVSLPVTPGEPYYMVMSANSSSGGGFKVGLNDRDPYPDGMAFIGIQDTPVVEQDITCKIYFGQ